MSAVPVLFVLASNYSGSHLLANVLGAHTRCADVGELRNLRKFLARPGRNRSGTESTYASSELFSGLMTQPETHWHAHLLERLRGDDPDLSVLVDNSKRTDWIERLVASGAVDARCVHLLRDPRAIARRWRDTFAAQGVSRRNRWREAKRSWRAAPAILAGPEMGVYAWRWLRENAAIADFLARHFPAAPRVSYEELLAFPERTLEGLMPRLGLEFERGQLDYGRAMQFGTRKGAWESARVDSAWQADERWLQETTASERAAVTGVASLRTLLAGFGYEMGVRGLQRCAGASGPGDEQEEERDDG
ncbi:MAG: sulfotransferase [Pseudomonadales bacterium]|nr:sulfotransferase [Pseudomonadales bacterium]